MNTESKPLLAMFGILTLLFVSISPMISADPPSASLSADILTDWTDDGTGNTTHAYRIVLSEELDFADLDLSLIHI